MPPTFLCPCGAECDQLEELPGGLCLGCYMATPQGQTCPTTAELTGRPEYVR